MKKVIIARFTGSFALLYASGITVLECIHICEGLTGNRAVERAASRAGKMIAEGASISAGFEATGLFSPLVLRMLKLGESTGRLDAALLNVTQYYSAGCNRIHGAAAGDAGPGDHTGAGGGAVLGHLLGCRADLRSHRGDRNVMAPRRVFGRVEWRGCRSIAGAVDPAARVRPRKPHSTSARRGPRNIPAICTGSPTEITCVIADVVEEEFREDRVPHVPVWERSAVLRTRARRAFHEASFVHATILAREQSGRRDDRVLFSAITRPGVLTACARADGTVRGTARRRLVAGRCSPEGLLKAIGAEAENVLVVSLQSGGGLRQTWLRTRTAASVPTRSDCRRRRRRRGQRADSRGDRANETLSRKSGGHCGARAVSTFTSWGTAPCWTPCAGRNVATRAMIRAIDGNARRPGGRCPPPRAANVGRRDGGGPLVRPRTARAATHQPLRAAGGHARIRHGTSSAPGL